MSKFIFDLEDGQYWLAGPQGALYFHTEGEEGINISEAGIGIRKLEKYEEDSKMSRKCADCKYFSTKLTEEPCSLCFDQALFTTVSESTAKADAGKPKLTLVPQQIIWDIAEVREYGNKKYGDPDNWKTVEKERYRDAAFRHMLQYLADPSGVDKESGISHLKHLACNIAFLCEMEALEHVHGEEDKNGYCKRM